MHNSDCWTPKPRSKHGSSTKSSKPADRRLPKRWVYPPCYDNYIIYGVSLSDCWGYWVGESGWERDDGDGHKCTSRKSRWILQWTDSRYQRDRGRSGSGDGRDYRIERGCGLERSLKCRKRTDLGDAASVRCLGFAGLRSRVCGLGCDCVGQSRGLYIGCRGYALDRYSMDDSLSSARCFDLCSPSYSMPLPSSKVPS